MLPLQESLVERSEDELKMLGPDVVLPLENGFRRQDDFAGDAVLGGEPITCCCQRVVV